MSFTDLSEQIEDLFNETQEAYATSVNIDVIRRTRYGNDPHYGFHTIRGSSKRPAADNRTRRNAEHREYMRAYMIRKECEAIRERILAGERPKSLQGGPGRRPTRWLAIAAELGVDLGGAPPAAPSCVNRQAAE
jgi:hypothetical protein